MAFTLEPKEPVVLLRTENVYQTDVDNGIVGYSDALLAVVADHANGGAPKDFNAMSMVGKSKRSAVAVRLYARISEKPGSEPFFEEVGFTTRGCLAITGCASMACTLVQGLTFSKAALLTVDDILKPLDGVPADKGFAPCFVICAIKGLMGDYWLRKGASLPELEQKIACDPAGYECLICEHCSLRSLKMDKRVQALENRL